MKNPKIIIVPDSFKGTMSAAKVASIISNAYRIVFPKATIIELPMADGGEGTLETLVSASNGEYTNVEVNDPLGNQVTAKYGLINSNKTAIIEMTQASGLVLIPTDNLNPMIASTFGTGQLIKDALNKGITDIIIGIGGSATVDGGIGMARALGYKFLDKNDSEILEVGASLQKIVSINSDNVISNLKNCKIKIACDVTNPLTGINGAAKIFGPQKGATNKMVKILEIGLLNLFNLCKKSNLINSEVAGDGAAGGLGFGLRAFCSAEITSGAELICNAVKLDDKIKNATLVITGEGKTDRQTLSGKICSVIAEHAKRANVKTLLISGSIENRDEILEKFDVVLSTYSGQKLLKEILYDAEKDLKFCALNSAKLLSTKINIG